MACGMVLKNCAFNEAITQFILGKCWFRKGAHSECRFPSIMKHWFLFPQADAHLRYTPQHKPLLLQLPNMKTIKITVSFSSVVFKAVTEICRILSALFHSSPSDFTFCLTLCSLFCLSVINKRSLSDLIFKRNPLCGPSSSDIRRSEELSLLKPPDDPSKKKKKKEKEHEHEDLWDIDLLSMGPGSAGTALLIERKIKYLPTVRQSLKYF